MTPRKFTFLLILLACFAFLGYVGFASNMTSVGYALDERSSEVAELREMESDLIIELAQTHSPDSVGQFTESLGLVEAGAVSGDIDTRAENLGLNDQ